MQELKPVARINEWHHCNVYFDEEGCPSAYEVIPDTHRIVSVELLQATMTGAYPFETKLCEKIRAIIDKEPT
jgi:hypothetical protein